MIRAEKRKWWVLGALTFGLLAVGLDITVLNVALPTLASELKASTTELQWFADAYNLVLAAALLPAGMLGDRYGRKRWLLIALVLFAGASAACAYSGTSGMLIAMRALLGLGAAFLIPLSMSILPVLFAGEERTRAMMLWATANMLGIPLGPIVGGWMLKQYAWGTVFLINLPLCAVAIAAVAWLMPESRSADKRRIDVPGIAASSLGLSAVTFGVIRGGEYGWGDAVSLATWIGGLVVLAAFIIWQRRARQPLIDLSLFRSSSFTWGSVLATFVSFALFGLLFTLPLFFQSINGVDTLTTGLRLLPLIGGLLVGAKTGQRLITTIGAKANAAAGFAAIAVGLFAGAATGTGSPFAYIVLWTVIVGIGMGLALPTVMDAALGTLTAERSGVGSALIMAMRQVGGAIGVALLGAALNRAYRGSLALTDLPEPLADTVRQSASAGMAFARAAGSDALLADVQHAFTSGMGTMLVICAGIAAAGFALAALFLPRRSPAAQVPPESPVVPGAGNR